jgi:hypothetical protein
VPPGAAVARLRRRGLPEFELVHAARMTSYLVAGSDAVVTDHVVRLTGVAPRSVESFLDEHRSSFAPTTTLARILTKGR